MGTIGPDFVPGAIVFCIVGALLIRFSAEVADWQAHMHDGIRESTSGRERRFWDWTAQPYANTDTNEGVVRGVGWILVLVGFLVLCGFVAHALCWLWF